MGSDSPAVAANNVASLPPEGRGLYRCVLWLIVMTFVLIKAGAMVTSTNSGMAFSTWPHADGYWLWPKDVNLGGALEHSHRLIGVFVGLWCIGLVVWVFRVDNRPFVRKLVLALFGLVCVQGLLGRQRIVLDAEFPFLYPVLHGTLAQVVLGIAAVLAFAVSTAWVSQTIAHAKPVRTLRRMAIVSLVFVFLQIFVGVVLRHTESGHAKWIHVFFALVVALTLLITVAYSMGRFNTVPGFKRMNRICIIVLACQVLLGFITLLVRRPKALADTESMGRAAIQSAHVVLGATLFMMATILVARSYRNLVPRPEAD